MTQNGYTSDQPEHDDNLKGDTPYIEYSAPSREAEASLHPAQQEIPRQQPPSVPVVSPVVPRRFSLVTILLLSLVIVLVIAGSGGLAYFTLAVQPGQMKAQATSVAGTVLANQVQRTASANAQASATFAVLTPQQVYQQATSGTPVLNDPLTTGQGSDWYQGSASGISCAFSGGAYHATASLNHDVVCPSFSAFFHNLAFQARVTIVSGAHAGSGLVFDEGSSAAYFFEVLPNGAYALLAASASSTAIVLASGSSRVINTGLNHANLLTIIDINGHIYLYINQQPIAHVDNDAITAGQIGLYADGSSTAANIAFNNLQVWSL